MPIVTMQSVICAPIPIGGRGIATDGLNVYWTIPLTNGPQSGGAVFRASVSGGQLTTIGSGQGFPWAVALDSRLVYWTNHGGINGGPEPSDGGSEVTSGPRRHSRGASDEIFALR